ncbi:hypothetical protein ACVMIH_007196 [Bradyrhizobium sp. USDA 4503]
MVGYHTRSESIVSSSVYTFTLLHRSLLAKETAQVIAYMREGDTLRSAWPATLNIRRLVRGQAPKGVRGQFSRQTTIFFNNVPSIVSGWILACQFLEIWNLGMLGMEETPYVPLDAPHSLSDNYVRID